MPLEIHEYAKIFPTMEAGAFQSLVVDICENGQKDPILLFEGKVLDGRHRYQACMTNGIQPLIAEFEGDQSEAVSLVMSRNMHRRHLSTSQRALIAARVREAVNKRRELRFGVGGLDLIVNSATDANQTDGENFPSGQDSERVSPKPQSFKSAAEVARVSDKQVKKAAKLLKTDRADLIAEVDAGEKTIHGALVEAEGPRPSDQGARIIKLANELIAAVDEGKDLQTALSVEQKTEIYNLLKPLENAGKRLLWVSDIS